MCLCSMSNFTPKRLTGPIFDICYEIGEGVPTELWVVTNPGKYGQPPEEVEIGDICFGRDLANLPVQFRGGLGPEDVIGYYADEATAMSRAEFYLEKYRRNYRPGASAQNIEICRPVTIAKKDEDDPFKHGWATGSMYCKKCGKEQHGVRFRYSCHDKVEGTWPRCCGMLMAFCDNWTSQSGD